MEKILTEKLIAVLVFVTKEKNISMRYLLKKIGLCKMFIYNAKKSPDIRLSTLLKISQALKIKLSQLIDILEFMAENHQIPTDELIAIARNLD